MAHLLAASSASSGRGGGGGGGRGHLATQGNFAANFGAALRHMRITRKAAKMLLQLQALKLHLKYSSSKTPSDNEKHALERVDATVSFLETLAKQAEDNASNSNGNVLALITERRDFLYVISGNDVAGSLARSDRGCHMLIAGAIGMQLLARARTHGTTPMACDKSAYDAQVERLTSEMLQLCGSMCVTTSQRVGMNGVAEKFRELLTSRRLNKTLLRLSALSAFFHAAAVANTGKHCFVTIAANCAKTLAMIAQLHTVGSAAAVLGFLQQRQELLRTLYSTKHTTVSDEDRNTKIVNETLYKVAATAVGVRLLNIMTATDPVE
jgi:hypothetical protein